MQEPQTQGITVTREQIGSYLSSLGERGRNPSTVSSYRKKLELLYAALPGGRIGRGTLRQWREQLLDQGYSPSTVNTSVSAANSFLEWLGCREFQLTGRLSCGRDAQLELTRSEYLRLLSTARALRQERVYLLIKLFTSTGLPVHELEQVTVEAAGEGGPAPPGGGDAPAPARLPPEGAAGLRPEAGDLLRPHLCHPHRPPLRPGRGLCQHPPALPGCPGPPGKGQPAVPAEAVLHHPSGDRGHCGPAGGADP